jgi:hypothetical protein
MCCIKAYQIIFVEGWKHERLRPKSIVSWERQQTLEKEDFYSLSLL